MLDFSPLMVSDEAIVSTDALLLHTIGAAAQATVAIILVGALYRIRRNGEIPRGFATIAVLISLASIARVSRLFLVWFGRTPPFWLDTTTLGLLLMTVLSVPVIVSAHYLSAEGSENPKRHRTDWLQWTIIGNAGGISVAFMVAFALRSRGLPPLIALAGCIISALLLWLRVSLFSNAQLRKRGLLLFSGFTATGLLGISVSLLLAYRAGPAGYTFFVSGANATVNLICMALVVLGLMFVFASVRLADVVLKRVVGVYIWSGMSLLVWKLATALSTLSPGDRDQSAGGALISFAIIAMALLLTPYGVRRLNAWIDSWVFEVPDFEAAIHQFWERLSSLDNRDAVYRAGEATIKDTLRIACARIVPETELPSREDLGASSGPNPRFLPSASPLSKVNSPPADVVLPLFQEGAPEYWIALSRGVMRPPWAATELSFVTRVAAEIQARMAALSAEERRLERLKREGALREQIADAELRALRAQINPHFLFNSLNTIADLAVVAPEKAEMMTMRLATVFRYVLVNTDRDFTSVKEEVNFARSYLDIEEARFENRLRVHFDVDESVLQETIPTLLLQPLIENSIKHGISPRREGGTLTITARRLPSGFELIVPDDGMGLEFSRKQQQNSRPHVGLQNVRKRLETAYDGRATFELRPRQGGGTEACLAFHTSKEEMHESTSRR